MRAIATLALMMGAVVTAAAGVPAHGRASVVPPGRSQTLAPDAPRPGVLRQASTYRLWPGRAPGANSDSPRETPTLTWYPPPSDSSNGTAVIIAPGGSYLGLAAELEGTEPASWFTTRGVTAFDLQYRVGRDARLPIPLLDGARAVRFLRAHAAQFHIDPHRIGMMGFSAGGHLTAMTVHGSGLGGGDPELSMWPQLLQNWMRRSGLL